MDLTAFSAEEFRDWAVEAPLRIALILVGGFVIARLVRRATRSAIVRTAQARWSQRVAAVGEMAPLGREAAIDEANQSQRIHQRTDALSAVVAGTTAFVIWMIAGFMVLDELGVNLGPLLAGAGVAGVAIGFGAQSIVRDFLSGFFILTEDQFAVGDIVNLGEAEGTVEEISLRSTRLRSVDGTVWHVPNGEILRVANMSQHWSRSLLDIEVAYDTDISKAEAVIKRVADELYEADPDIIDEPKVWGVEMLGASGITIRLVVKTRPSEQWRISRALRLKIKEAFDAEGIEIPFPQQTVWHKST